MVIGRHRVGRVGDREARDLLGRERDREAEHRQHYRDGAHGGSLPGQQPLGRDQRGDEGHPADAHHAEREQRGHQPPAAADADAAVLDPHPQRAEATRVPVAQEIAGLRQWRRQASFGVVSW